VRASIIVATHNRPEKLSETLINLTRQSVDTREFEIIVVDDGSEPPVQLSDEAPANLRLLRLSNVERSAARNAGAQSATGELLIFVDDDITVQPDFVNKHVAAQREWPGALQVGAIRLPEDASSTSFGRFRQQLEDTGIPLARGLTSMPNFCAAANMAISKARFEELGGFDVTLSSSEDQDFALRHTSSGGRIAFVPEARVVHRDGALDIQSYCKRAEWGAANMLPFVERYPDFADNVVRKRVNGALQIGAEPLTDSARKLFKTLLATKPLSRLLVASARMLERAAPDSSLLDRVYRMILGVHIFRGFRRSQ